METSNLPTSAQATQLSKRQTRSGATPLQRTLGMHTQPPAALAIVLRKCAADTLHPEDLIGVSRHREQTHLSSL